MNLIKNSIKFNELVRELARSLLKKKLSEITTTASIDGYETPNAFGKTSKKRKKNLEKQTGYKFVDEATNDSDMKKIKDAIRKEVSDILRDIWIKRTSWGGR
jgi:hypothetical protein|tara:strand:- start:1428 stop:1733 length:306 start_codon:yes stop_codon:yes gene_type:complete